MSVWHAIVYCSCFMLFVCPIVRAQYYSICSDLGYSNIDLVRSSGFILVGSGETENSTSYKPNLQCQRLVRVPFGWTLAVKARYKELEFRDYLRVFDGGYEARHVDEITPFDFKLRAAHATGNSLLLSFTSDSSNIQSRKGFLLEIWANYTSSRTCNCQAIHNGETMCDFKKGTVSKGERFKSCEIKCDSGTIITRSNYFQNNIDETIRCNLNNGKWLRKEIVGLYQATDFLETPVQCENHTVPRKMLAQYSFKYANSSCSFVNSSFEEIRTHVKEAINATSLPAEGVCFSETKNSGCLLHSLELSCEDNSTGSENQTKLTLRIRDQLAKPNVTGADFVALRGAFSSLTSKIEKYVSLGKFSVTRDNATVKATRFKHEDSLGLCPSPQVYINAPIFQGACTYCSSGYEYRSDPCLYNRCTHKCVKCSKGTPCFASAPPGLHSYCNMKCPLGKGYNQTLGFCDWCPYDTYQNDSSTPQASCVKCPLHKHRTPYVGAASETDCMQPCTAGEYVVVKKNVPPECKPCPIGTYANIFVSHMERQCKKCPSIKPITQSNGSTKADDCIEKCPTGKFFNVSAKQCEKCDKNTYQDEQGRFACKNCPPGNVTVGPGKKGVRYCFSPCAAGTFVNLAVNPIRCDRCPVGTFQDQKNHEKQECKSCGVYETTNITGAINATQCFWVCVQGEFYNLTSQQCERCTRGTYQDERAQETCKLCPDGKVTLRLGSKTLSDCIPSCGAGKYMDHNKRPGRCLDCSVGTYQDRVNNSAGSESCLKCPDLKTTTAAKGAENVYKCIPYCAVSKRCENGGTCANKDGGYTCVCANGLKGSHCELIMEGSKAENVTFNLTVTSLKWKEELRDPNSDEFRETADVVEDAVRSELRNDNTFRTVRVRGFSKGSVVTDFDVSYIPDNSSGMPVAGLTKAVASGQVGGLTVVNDSLAVVSYTCQQPLGMEDGRIKDGWITASTSRGDEWPWHARLNNPSHVGWCDTPGSIKKPYLQIDFNRRVIITGVATQGKLGSRFVKKYELAFTNNITFWQIYPDSAGQEKEFSGNVDHTTVVKHHLPKPVAARFLRFFPSDYKYQICLRVEVYGCTLPEGTTATIKPTLPSLPIAPTHETLTLYTGTAATSTSQASVTTSLVTPRKKDNKTGTIVASVIAVLLFMFIVALVIYCCHRKKIACVGPGYAPFAEPAVKLKRISSKQHENDDFVAVLQDNAYA